MLKQSKDVVLPSAKIGEMGAADAHGAGQRIEDFMMGIRSREAAGTPVAAMDQGMGEIYAPSALSRSQAAPAAASHQDVPSVSQPVSESPVPQGRKVKEFALSIVRMALSGAAAYGLHTLAATLLPAVFGTLPIAALWAVSSGVLLLPAALYARHRLTLRDSKRLDGVKLLHDVVTGVFLGAVAVAYPALSAGLSLDGLMLALPAVAAASFAAASAARGGGGGILDAVLTWGSLNLLAPLMGAVAASPLTLGGVFGLMALPAMTTVSFFLGRIIASAESGRPFSVPGSTQKIRFPAYTWVMTGVVFSLLTGYSPVWTNVAFGLWMFLGQSRAFDLAYLGILGWAAATGFAAPVTFLAIAFAPERAATWTEKLLGRLLPEGRPAPSTRVKPVRVDETAKPERWPRFNYVLKTAAAIGGLATLGGVLGASVFGIQSFLINALIAGAISMIPFFFAKKLIKATMQAAPMSEAENPEIYGMMRALRETINKDRQARGLKPIPMPEMVDIPMPVPNAFATGASPMNAMVGVTGEMKDMTLNPERTREGLIRLLSMTDQDTKSFLVYRKAIRGSISGIREDADSLDLIEAVRGAPAAEVKALGMRALNGVLAHEFSHVMHRDMLLGVIAGTLASAISFSAYGVLWAVGHAKKALAAWWRSVTRKPQAAQRRDARRRGLSADASVRTEPVRPEMVEPVSAGAAVVSLVKIFVALWAPIVATLIHMAESRTREGYADEGGALLSGDGESLALGLGFLTSWRPKPGVSIGAEVLPLLASQAHMMTVNPFEQLKKGGVRPSLDFLTRAIVGKADDFFFNLFITHPDTTQRIERLWEMSGAGGKSPR